LFFAIAVGFHFFFPVLDSSVHLTHTMAVAALAFVSTFVLVFVAILSARSGRNGFEISPWFAGWIVGGLLFFWIGVLVLGRLRYGVVAGGIWSGVMLVIWFDVRRDRRRSPVTLRGRSVGVRRRAADLRQRNNVP